MSRTKRLTEIEKMQIVREAAEGLSTSELAERFEVTSRAVRYVLKADAERQTDAAIPVSAVSVKVTAAELAALDEVLAEAGIESRAEGLRRLIQAAGGVFVPDAQMAAEMAQANRQGQMEWLPPSLNGIVVCQGGDVYSHKQRGRQHMDTMIGVDLAKSVYQIHGASMTGAVKFRKKLTRPQFLRFMSEQAPAVVVMEACGGAHYWSRVMEELAHEVKLIAPQYVRPFVKRQKNDAADAEAIVIAAQRPEMRFVEPKTEEQQARAALFRSRERLVKRRTELINALRGVLYEHGHSFPTGARNLGRIETLRAGEVVRLKVGDIDSAQEIIRIVQAKGRKDRNVMLPADILGLLREWWKERPTSQDKDVPAPERVLFPGYRGKHLSARQISRLFKETAHEAGITKPVTLHTLRHSFATHLLEIRVDIRIIQALLGHTKLTTTARYASVATGMIAAVDSPLDDLNQTKRKKGKARPS